MQSTPCQSTISIVLVCVISNVVMAPFNLQFIQPKSKQPTESFKFTVPMWAVQYLYSVRYYLRQNLLQNPFLHPPKYIDSKPDHHFQDCNSWRGRTGSGPGPGAVLEPSEMDVFLYNRPHKAEGGTGKLGRVPTIRRLKKAVVCFAFQMRLLVPLH